MKIFILSPHVDDAAYGLTLSIARFINKKIPVTIINCFTVTKWSIVYVSKDVEQVSLVRKQEDIEYNKLFNSSINIVNLELLDAPLRSGYIFQDEPFKQIEWQAVEDLKNYVNKNVDGLLLCPLGIGDHVDHAICREAVAQLYCKLKVLFFEDLPYASRIDECAICEHIKVLEKQLNVKLVSHLNFVRDCTINKEQAIRTYKSQLNDEICSEIIKHMDVLEGERIWGEEKLIDELKRELNSIKRET